MDLELYEQHGTLPAVDGVPLFYGRAGTTTAGVPLVLNDGIGCDGFAWRYLMPKLAERHPVVHWNYRSHGRSGSGANLSRLTLPALTGSGKTIVYVLMGGDSAVSEEVVATLRAQNVPLLRSPERALRAIDRVTEGRRAIARARVSRRLPAPPRSRYVTPNASPP